PDPDRHHPVGKLPKLAREWRQDVVWDNRLNVADSRIPSANNAVGPVDAHARVGNVCLKYRIEWHPVQRPCPRNVPVVTADYHVQGSACIRDPNGGYEGDADQ